MSSQPADAERARSPEPGSQPRCPFATTGAPATTPTGCPVSDAAAAFDAFEGAYQIDPSTALRWSRDEEPVFYSPKLGYWVVTRYQDVKAIFRDNETFSPSIALEKITPVSQQAQDVLARYDYQMNRTLVNEDEPAHMARRRALYHSFTPDELAHQEPMVRRLTSERIDRIIDRGEADLVDEMLWEIPLTVALYFLGVPEEDMDTLRRYSIAHTINTWGRPSVAEQVHVADTVGKFWQFAGEVLAKMRATPNEHGWMRYAIRQQKEMPEVVTDSYLHSMMMAIIVAAHETTAHAAANALRLLLENREAWNDICANPELIPNAAEECLRHKGSVVAWRRRATVDTVIDGVAIPKDAKLLIVSASANHDERHFDNADALDIYREAATDHLTFGYGAHQCMGKNLARMEMRILLEQLSKRLPHMELVPDQRFTYLPNTSFRGPDHLWVRWDPADNPERDDPGARSRHTHFEIGAPSVQAVARPAIVSDRQALADGVVQLTLENPEQRPWPAWTPGAHISLIAGGYLRHYSLCGAPDDRRRLQIAVLAEADGRGGSAHIHDHVAAGARLRLRGPKNNFRLDENAGGYVLVAGGIGITPIIAMADRLRALDKPYAIHYAGRSRTTMAFLARLERAHGKHLHVYPADAGKRLNVEAVIGETRDDTLIYACGPQRLLDALEAATANWPGERLVTERFASVAGLADPDNDAPFAAELADSDLTVEVRADQTLLAALRGAGIDVASDCEEGLCGTCEVGLVSGEVEHRDTVLSSAERQRGERMMACCSRARGKKITLAL